jgi:DNA-binding transcriptional ArsR family regulator
MQIELMKALGDGTRLAIFERLCQQEFTVNELTAQFDVSQPAISQHLGVLKRCGLAQERRAGRFAHYRGRPEGLRPMVQWLGHYREFWPGKLKALGALLERQEADAATKAGTEKGEVTRKL